VHRWLVAIAVMVPAPALACSGPGAMAAIEAAAPLACAMLYMLGVRRATRAADPERL